MRVAASLVALVATSVLPAVFAPTLAFATPEDARRLEQDLELTYSLSCRLCHTEGDGGADTPFGASLAAHGFRVDDPPSLEAAVANLRKDGVDSDGDGARDLDELAWGGDPNHADLPAGGEAQVPAYGCSTTVGSPERAADRAVFCLGALSLVLISSRKRARRSRSFRRLGR